MKLTADGPTQQMQKSRGISKGNLQSTLLFILAMISLNYVRRKYLVATKLQNLKSAGAVEYTDCISSKK